MPISLETLRNQKDENGCKYFFETGPYHAITLEKSVKVFSVQWFKEES